MFRTRVTPSGRSLKGQNRRDEVLSLDLSGGRTGILQQVLPVVCRPTGQPTHRRLQYFNAAVRSLQQLQALHNKTNAPSSPTSQGDGFINKKEENGENLNSPDAKTGFNTYKDVVNQKNEVISQVKVLQDLMEEGSNKIKKLNDDGSPSFLGLSSNDNLCVQRTNEINKESSRSLRDGSAEDKYITPKNDKKGIISCSATTQACLSSSSGGRYTRLEGSCRAPNFSGQDILGNTESSHSETGKQVLSGGGGQQNRDENGCIDFRENLYTMDEYFCMLRCCLVADCQEVRAAGLRLIRYLLDTPSDGTALVRSNVVPLIVRSLDSVGGTNAAERLQALRLIRRLVQVSSDKSSDSTDNDDQKDEKQPLGEFPSALAYCLVALGRGGLHNRDNFLFASLAVLAELVIAHPDTSLQCGALIPLQRSLLENSSVPRIHEALLASLLRLVNTPRHRHYTKHLLQVLAPYSDFQYSHYTNKPEHALSIEEQKLRLSSARLCLLVLLRSWPGLLLVTKDNMAALRAITAQLAHSPHPTITTAIVNVLYELFSIRESPFFKKDGGGTEKEKGGTGRSTPASSAYTLRGGIYEVEEWETVVTAHLRTPAHSPDGWSLYEGFVAAEAKSSLPHLARCRPNLVQNQLSLVLYSFIKAGLLGALCHVIINSSMPLALRATILLGELVHRAHQDLPVECSQLTHALPELMNQAATNYNKFSSSAASDDIIGGSKQVSAKMQHQQQQQNLLLHHHHLNVHSSNPTVNIDLNSMSLLLAEKAKKSSCDGLLDALHGSKGFGNATNAMPSNLPCGTNVANALLATTGLPDSKSTSSLLCTNVSNLYPKLVFPDILEPTDPFSIPTTTCITNAATSNITQPQRRARASLAISALLKLSRGRLNPPALPPQHSLYLAHLLHALPFAGSNTTTLGGGSCSTSGTGGRGSLGDGTVQLQQVYLRKKMVVTPANDMAKMSKWLGGGSDLDEMVHRSVKRSHVMTRGHDQHTWNWDIIMAVLRWPGAALQRINSATYRLFIRRLVHFYKPSAELFSKTAAGHPQARQEAETLMLLAHFLLQVPESDPGRHLEELMLDLLSHLKHVSCKHPSLDMLLAPGALTGTCSHYYFLLAGVLSRSSRGHHMLVQSGVFEQLYEVVNSVTSHDMYAKLIASSLDYSIEGPNRTILSTILRSPDSPESCRVYGTSLLRALLRSQACPHTLRWTLQQLVRQLYDDSTQVCLLALSILYEVTEVPHILASLVRTAPLLPPRLGPHTQLLTARMLQAPFAFNAFSGYDLMDGILALWDDSFNIKYVQLQESAVCESLTQHRRDESGRYGRRSSAPLSTQEAFTLPHLYGSLVQHREGLATLLRHQHLDQLLQTVKKADMASSRSVTLLKAAIWAVCHAGSSSSGLQQLLLPYGGLEAVVRLAASAPVYSVRGTCYMALCVVATTHAGVMALREYGWESVVRAHHQRWQSNLHPLLEPTTPHPSHQPPHCPAYHQHPPPEPPASSKGPYFTALNEDNYIGHTPRAGFYVSGDSDEDDEEEDDDGDSGSGSDEGGSYVVSGIGLDDASLPPLPSRKAQTLPNKTRTPTCRGHQRSLSDCAPLTEEVIPPGAVGGGGGGGEAVCDCGAPIATSTNTSSTTPHRQHSSSVSSKGWVRRGSLRLKNKILSSMKRRSERKRLDSTASTTSSNRSRLRNELTTSSSDHCCDSSPSPRILDTPTPPSLPSDLPSSHSPRQPPTSPFFSDLTEAAQRHPQSACSSPYPLSPETLTGSEGWWSPPTPCPRCRLISPAPRPSPAPPSHHPPGCRCGQAKVDVAVQLSPIDSGGSLSATGSILSSDVRGGGRISSETGQRLGPPPTLGDGTSAVPTNAVTTKEDVARPGFEDSRSVGAMKAAPCYLRQMPQHEDAFVSSCQDSMSLPTNIRNASSQTVTAPASGICSPEDTTRFFSGGDRTEEDQEKHSRRVALPPLSMPVTRICTCQTTRKISSPGLSLPGLTTSSSGVTSSTVSSCSTTHRNIPCSQPQHPSCCVGRPAAASGRSTALCGGCQASPAVAGTSTSSNTSTTGPHQSQWPILARNASQGSMVSVPSHVSLQGCQVLLAMTEQRRASSETQQQQDQRKRDYLTTLLSDTSHHDTYSPTLAYFRSGAGEGRTAFPHTATGISRISSSGSISNPLVISLPYVPVTATSYPIPGPSSFSGSSYSPAVQQLQPIVAACGEGTVDKFLDAKHSCSIESYSVINSDDLGRMRGGTSPLIASNFRRDPVQTRCSCSTVNRSTGDSCAHCQPITSASVGVTLPLGSSSYISSGGTSAITCSRIGTSTTNCCHCGIGLSDSNHHSQHIQQHRSNTTTTTTTAGCSKCCGAESCDGGVSSRPPNSNRVWGHKAAYPVSWCGPRYVGLCMPLDLNLLLNSDCHWDKAPPQDQEVMTGRLRRGVAEERNDFKEENGCDRSENGSDNREKGDEEKPSIAEAAVHSNKFSGDEKEQKVIVDKDKWREDDATSRLETVREESFNSGDGVSSLQSVSLSTATLDSCRTTTTAITNPSSTLTNDHDTTATFSCETQSDTGLVLHSKATCLGCFSLCQRREISQPTDQVSNTIDQLGVASVWGTTLMAGLKPSNLDDGSRPETPVDRWEGLAAGGGATGTAGGGGGGGVRGQVLVRKEVLRYITAMPNPLFEKFSESGLLAVKQRWPDAFRDVCLYSEVCEMLGSCTYSLTARHFIQEMFSDVPFKEVFDEAEVLLQRLPNTATTSKDPSSPPHVTEPILFIGHLKTNMKMLNTEVPHLSTMDGRGNGGGSGDAKKDGKIPLPGLSSTVEKFSGGGGRLDEPLFIVENKLDPFADFDGYCGFTDDRSEYGDEDSDGKEHQDVKTIDERILHNPDHSQSSQSDNVTSSLMNRRSVVLLRAPAGDRGSGVSQVVVSVSSENNASAEVGLDSEPGNISGGVGSSDAGDRKSDGHPNAYAKGHPIAEGGIVLLSTNSCRSRANLTLSDYEGLSTDDEDNDNDSS